MALPGLVAAQNLADVAVRERAGDILGFNIGADFSGVTTPESTAYIEAVEAADAAFLEEGVKAAIHAFVVGCKIDGIWPAIRTSCIMAGARTRLGAMVPLVGAAPTSFNFVNGDYDRKTGLVGNGGNKFLNANRNITEDPIDNCHLAVYLSTPLGTSSAIGFAGGTSYEKRLSELGVQLYSNVPLTSAAPGSNIGFYGGARPGGTTIQGRVGGVTTTSAIIPNAPASQPTTVFARSLAGANATSARLAFYSIGESLDLALLDARVTTLINAFAAAIP